MGVINMAHGEMTIMPATTFVCRKSSGDHAAEAFVLYRGVHSRRVHSRCTPRNTDRAGCIRFL